MIHGLAVFAGVGGLELGLHLAIPNYRCVGYVEREAFAAACLVARMEDAALDPAPVWDDIATFDGRPWRGVVDIISGGFPCTDISVAGRREGIKGKSSGLWSEYARLIGEIRPQFVFVENVAALAIRGLDTVLADLASRGYDAEWATLAAADVGAPHRRERIFILAHSQGDHRRRGERRTKAGARTKERRGRGPAGGGARTMAHSDVGRLEGRRQSQRGEHEGTPGREPDGCGTDRGFEGEALSLWPPGPSDMHAWRRVQADAQPAVCRVAHELAHRVDRLRATGNGVCPIQAAVAFRILADRIGI